MRAALYQGAKLQLGCLTEEKCPDFELRQHEACEVCPKLLRPVEPEPDPITLKRLQFLVRIESMVNVGCKFGPADLPARVWQELIWLTIERQRMDRLVMEQKDVTRQKKAEEEKRLAALRQESGVPPPGQSLFKGGGRRR